MNTKWFRVTKARKCAVCSHGDWCTYNENGACCMRVTSSKTMANGGYWHPIDSPVERLQYLKPQEEDRTTINATAMMRDWQAKTEDADLLPLCKSTGLDLSALKALGTAWAAPHRAWAFPMKDRYGNTIGIRLRNLEGKKWAVSGSRAGLFYSELPKGFTVICEGPTDTCAALMLGLCAVGRPSCSGSEDMLLQALKGSNRVLIIADNDGPGWAGAEKFQERLKVPSLVWSPPAKDLREFMTMGGTQQMLMNLTRSLIWRTPNK